MKKVVIAGAGLTGLAAAYFLKKRKIDALLVEKEARPGGLCKSEEEGVFFFDYTGHLLHFKNQKWKKFIEDDLRIPLKKNVRNSSIYLFDRFIPYPFQYNLAHLPPSVRQKCLADFLSAKGCAETSASFHTWAENSFGSEMNRIFFKPYNEKLWKFDLKKLSTGWMGRFVPRPDRSLVVDGAQNKKEFSAGYNQVFYYPRKGGIGRLTEVLAKGEKILNNCAITEINALKKEITAGGRKIKYDSLISTLPLPRLAKITRGVRGISEKGRHLKWVGVYNLNIVFRANLEKFGHWIYFPEGKFEFYRIGILSNFAKLPRGFSSVYVEISYRGKIPRADIAPVLKFFKLKKRQVELVKTLDIPCAYVIYDFEKEKLTAEILEALRKKDIISIGRYGGWKYSTMEEAFEDGFLAAEEIAKREEGR